MMLWEAATQKTEQLVNGLDDGISPLWVLQGIRIAQSAMAFLAPSHPISRSTC